MRQTLILIYYALSIVDKVMKYCCCVLPTHCSNGNNGEHKAVAIYYAV